MILSLLFAASIAGSSAIPSSDFDLADITTGSQPADRDPNARYLLPEIDEPDENENGVRLKLRWRKVRLTVPLAGLQPPF